MAATYLLSLLSILDIFPQIFSPGLLRTDYYESFSRPIKCLVVSHYHISGPQLLFANLDYYAYRYDVEDDDDINKIYHYDWKMFFKKINRKCLNSIIFNSKIKDLKKIKLLISLYLGEWTPKLGNIAYTFYEGIRAGDFQLWDLNEHFSVNIEIVDGVEYPVKEFITPPRGIKSYLNSIYKNRGDLCIETDFTGPAVLSPEYGSEKPDGLITNFEVDLFQNGISVGDRKYSAFECNKTQLTFNEPVILIVDKPKFDIKFYVIATKLSDGKKIDRKYEFNLTYAEFIYVNDVDAIPGNRNKVYLIKPKLKDIKCKNGSKRYAYLSNDGTIYHVLEYVAKNVTSNLERKLRISHPLSDEC